MSFNSRSFYIRSYDTIPEAMSAFRDRGLVKQYIEIKKEAISAQSRLSDWLELLRLIVTLGSNDTSDYSIFRQPRVRDYAKYLNHSSVWLFVDFMSEREILINSNLWYQGSTDNDIHSLYENVLEAFWNSFDDYCQNLCDNDKKEIIMTLKAQNETKYIDYQSILGLWTAVEDLNAPWGFNKIGPVEGMKNSDSFTLLFRSDYSVSLGGYSAGAIYLQRALYNRDTHYIFYNDLPIARVLCFDNSGLRVRYYYSIDVERMEKEGLAFGRREGGKQFIIKNNSPAELLFIKCPDSR